MAIRTKTIQNVSNQAIEFLYKQGDASNAAGDIPTTKSGMLRIASGTETTIEEARIDIGQLQNLEGKNLIKVSDGLI